MSPQATLAGIPRGRLRARPYLHVDPDDWEHLRARLTDRPHQGLQQCRHDARPGPLRAPRFNTAVLEAAAFVAAVTEARADREFLRTHVDMILAARGMGMIGVLRGHFLAALAFACDVLDESLDGPLRSALRRTLVDHAGRAAEAIRQGMLGGWPYESPKAVATLAGLNLAGLALLGEEEAAVDWLEVSDFRLERLLETVATDGWWPTGFEDWNLLLPLLVRVADAWARLADRDRFDCGLFREAWAVAVHGLPPGEAECLDLDRVGRRDSSRAEAEAAERRGQQQRWLQEPCTWALDRLHLRFDDARFRLAAERWRAAGLGRGSPWAVLWSPAGPPRQVEPDRPYHLFAAHGLAVWRTSWRPDALALAFATGPAYGTPEPEWRPAETLDADANHFLLWHGGEALAIDGGRLGQGSEWHNTVLVAGRGQRSPDKTSAGLTSCWLSALGGSLTGQADDCYPPELGVELFRRHLAFAPEYVLLWDELAATRPRRYDWLLQTHGQVTLEPETASARVRVRGRGLRVTALRPSRLQLTLEPRRREGAVEPVGQALHLTTPEAVGRTQFLVLLLPLAAVAPIMPEAHLLTGESAVGARLVRPDGLTEEILWPTQPTGIVLEHLLSDARCLALQRTAAGPWRRLLARRTSQILVPGGELLTASQPVDVALLVDESGLAGEVQTTTGATVTIHCPFPPRGVLIDGQTGRARVDRRDRQVSLRLTAGRHHVKVTPR